VANLKELIRRVSQVKHGFTDIRRAATELTKSETPATRTKLAKQLLKQRPHQARMLGVFLLGGLAADTPAALRVLRSSVSRDADWRVQEILAQAFDAYCAVKGYENVLPVIRSWLADPHPNVRRAASEGLRIWTARPYFREHPQAAIKLLARNRGDASEYVRKSVGNALRDISRKHKQLVAAELQKWNLEGEASSKTHRLASKFLNAK
jgi:3-methyladenine DNA glycosylase AlkD